MFVNCFREEDLIIEEVEEWKDSEGELPDIKVEIDNSIEESEEGEVGEVDMDKTEEGEVEDDKTEEGEVVEDNVVMSEDRVEEIMRGSEEEKDMQFESAFWEIFFKHRRREVSVASRALEFLPEPADVSEVVMFRNPPV